MKISVVIPNYNYANYISQTIESIINQDYKNFEIIIVDDGSNDNSINVINDYLIHYPFCIKLVCQKNQGQAFAVNTGLKEVTGDIITWINSDDYYEPGVFRIINKIFSKNENIDIVYGNINYVDLDSVFINRLRHFKFSYTRAVFTGFANNLSNNSFFWRKTSFNKNLFLDTSFKCSLDSELFSRMTYKKYLFHIPKPLANFRKQIISKAATDIKSWELLIQKETEIVFNQSYRNLFISRYISVSIAYKYRFIYIYLFRLKKFITFRYIINVFERIKYKKMKK